MENKLYTKGQIKDAIWKELKDSGHTGDNNDRAYEIIGVVMAGIEKITPVNAPTGLRWVKASTPGIKDGHYVAKYKPDDIQLAYDPVGMAFVNADRIHFVCPSIYDIEWAKGHEELQYLQILDESTPAGREEATDVFVPCAEDDPDRCGGYTSDDGRSLCYVKVQHVTVSALKQKGGKL